jgi:hypothetical protein
MNISQRFLSADEVKAQIARLLTDCPELREDDEGLILSLESETDATELCTRLVRKIKENEAYSNGTAAYIAELKGRIEMFDRRDIAMRALLLTIMQTAGLSKLPLSIGTISASPSRHLVIVDREQIPGRFRRYPEWEPMKNDIKAALKAGEAVPGVTLSNPEPHITIRLK